MISRRPSSQVPKRSQLFNSKQFSSLYSQPELRATTQCLSKATRVEVKVLQLLQSLQIWWCPLKRISWCSHSQYHPHTIQHRMLSSSEQWMPQVQHLLISKGHLDSQTCRTKEQQQEWWVQCLSILMALLTGISPLQWSNSMSLGRVTTLINQHHIF